VLTIKLHDNRHKIWIISWKKLEEKKGPHERKEGKKYEDHFSIHQMLNYEFKTNNFKNNKNN